jgi:hypothetical protein
MHSINPVAGTRYDDYLCVEVTQTNAPRTRRRAERGRVWSVTCVRFGTRTIAKRIIILRTVRATFVIISIAAICYTRCVTNEME